MSTNKKASPNDEMELTSEETTSDSEHTERSSSPDPQCPICLDDINNECHTDSCVHSFCYVCLARWSNTRNSCPICRRDFNLIYHAFDGQDSLQTHNMIQTADLPLPPPVASDEFLVAVDYRSATVMRPQYQIDGVLRTMFSLNDLGIVEYSVNGIIQFQIPTTPLDPIEGQIVRRNVYAQNVWAAPLHNTIARECSLAFYRGHPSETRRLYVFILRDVVAIQQVRTPQSWNIYNPRNIDVAVTNMIMRALVNYDIRRLHLYNILRSFMGEHLEHFCHELYHFARGSYNIFDYDRNVLHLPSRMMEPGEESDVEIESDSSSSTEPL